LVASLDDQDTDVTGLAAKDCVPCKGGVPPLTPEQIGPLLSQLDGWQTVNDHHLTREYTFPDFVTALERVNRVGRLAEQQGHHPDIYLAWGKLRIDIWTHKIDGLTESDFILAAKLDELGSS
jgi:4a-hydroxytetrahydrobiopterin dehydratase